jgi:predicted nucleotidyltransferase
VNNIDIEHYKQFHKKRDNEQFLEREKKRQSIISAFTELTQIFKQLDAVKVIIYGSVLTPGQFYQQSDLDILVFGLNDDQWVEAFRKVESIERLKHTPIDIKFDRMVDNRFIDYILMHCEHMTIL